MINLQEYIDGILAGDIFLIFQTVVALALAFLVIASFRNLFTGKYAKWTLSFFQLIVMIVLFRLPAEVYIDAYLRVSDWLG